MSASASLPACEHVRPELGDAGVLRLTFDRPEVRNAMSLKMISELESIFDAIRARRDVRVVVLRGAGGHFCAGGDIKDMAAARALPARDGEPDALEVTNRAFGTMITKIDRAPQAVVAVLEGTVLGGGMGLACVADVAIALADAKLGLPETSLGIPPAQIAPLLVQRLGLSQARRLAVTGGRFDGRQAQAIGLVHAVAEDDAALQMELEATLARILRCAPEAVAATKHLMLQVGTVDRDALLDEGARLFAKAARGSEGIEGMTAFIQKRAPKWTGGGT